MIMEKVNKDVFIMLLIFRLIIGKTGNPSSVSLPIQTTLSTLIMLLSTRPPPFDTLPN